MKTRDKKPNPWTALFEAAFASPRSWMPLVRARQQDLAWALDVAEAMARELAPWADTKAVQRVRAFMQARLGGFPLHWSLLDHDDLVYTVGLFLCAIDRDLGPVEHRSTGFVNEPETPDDVELWWRVLADRARVKRNEDNVQKENVS